MKLLVACVLVGLAAARPQEYEETAVFETEGGPQFKTLEDAGILRMESTQNEDGSFQYGFETTDPIQQDVAGQIKQIGEEVGVVMQGSYSFIAKDENGNDVPVEIRWVADENGFRAEGDAIPQDANSEAQAAAYDAAGEYQEGQDEFN